MGILIFILIAIVSAIFAISEPLDRIGKWETEISANELFSAFFTGFGCGGAFSMSSGVGVLDAGVTGILCGCFAVALDYVILSVAYWHFGKRPVPCEQVVNCTGRAITELNGVDKGEVSISFKNRWITYPAHAENGKFIPQGGYVKVVAPMGARLLVTSL